MLVRWSQMATTKTHLLHLIAWAQIGVVIRVYLGLLFGGACHEYRWAPCVTSPGTRVGGALFTDLPANILGSFLMGLFVSSDVLSSSLKHTLTVEAPLALLSVRSPLQAHLPLHVGLRTGLCGSLTTFASWNLQMVVMFVGGRPLQTAYGAQWVDALAGLIIGTFCAMAALVVGQHTALMAYHKLNPGAFIPYSAPVKEEVQKIVPQADVDVGKPTAQPAEEELIIEEQDFAAGPIRRFSSRAASMQLAEQRKLLEVELQIQQHPVFQETTTAAQPAAAAAQSQSVASTAGAISADADGLTAAGQQESTCPAAVSRTQPHLSASQPPHDAAATQQHPTEHRFASGSAHISIDSRSLSPSTQAANFGSIPATDSLDNLSVSETTDIEADNEPRLASVLAADAFAGASMVVLTGISLWRIIQGSLGSDLVSMHDVFAQQYIWWSVIMGPLGCYIRYYLSRYNGVLAGHWKWFPLGTFTANISACVMDYAVKAALARATLDAVSTAVLSGVVSGIGGCLSTVSTWVVEIQRLLLTFPNTHHGYNYVLISFLASFTSGFIIYGIPVWTMPLALP